MKYYGYKNLLEKTGLPEGTICSRLYDKTLSQRYGVEVINGKKVVSRRNFNKYNWTSKWQVGRKKKNT